MASIQKRHCRRRECADRITAGSSIVFYFLQGVTLGLAYTAPIGVQNMFVINAGMSRPRAEAYRTALIVIFFDVTLALAGFFGAGILMERFFLVRAGVLCLGSLLVIYMGLRLIRSPAASPEVAERELPLKRVVCMACAVTWFNPQAVVDVTLLLGAFRASLPGAASTVFLAGVVFASCLWFLGLTTLTTLFRSRISATVLRWINVICGVVILGYGLRLGWTLIGLIG